MIFYFKLGNLRIGFLSFFCLFYFLSLFFQSLLIFLVFPFSSAFSNCFSFFCLFFLSSCFFSISFYFSLLSFLILIWFSITTRQLFTFTELEHLGSIFSLISTTLIFFFFCLFSLFFLSSLFSSPYSIRGTRLFTFKELEHLGLSFAPYLIYWNYSADHTFDFIQQMSIKSFSICFGFCPIKDRQPIVLPKKIEKIE